MSSGSDTSNSGNDTNDTINSIAALSWVSHERRPDAVRCSSKDSMPTMARAQCRVLLLNITHYVIAQIVIVYSAMTLLMITINSNNE